MRALGVIAIIMLLFSAAVRPAMANAVELTVLSPMEGERVIGSSIQVVFEVADLTITPSSVSVAEAGKRPDANRAGEGHIHLMLDLEPVVVWEQVEPYTFENVRPGVHQVTIEVVNNDHSSLSPRVVVQRTVQVVASETAPANQSVGSSAGSGNGDTTHDMPLYTLPNTGIDPFMGNSRERALLGAGLVLMLVGAGMRRRLRSLA